MGGGLSNLLTKSFQIRFVIAVRNVVQVRVQLQNVVDISFGTSRCRRELSNSLAISYLMKPR